MKNILSFAVLLFFFTPQLFSQWNPQGSGVWSNIYSVFSIDGQTAWISGANGIIFKTTNGGASWVQKNSGTSLTLGYIYFFNENEGIAAGNNGTIKRTTDGGNTWYTVSSGTSNNLNDGSVINDSLMYLIGWNGTLLITTDKGDTWEQKPPISSSNYHWVQFWDENLGWASTWFNGQIWKTTDGGNTWSMKAQVGSISLWQVCFVTPEKGFAVGEWGVILKSTDGGENWTQYFAGTTENLHAVTFITPEVGWIVGKDENRLRTSNGGDSWIIEHTGNDYEYLQIYFYDEKNGWILGTPGFWTGNPSVILYTDNNGGYPFQTSPISIIAPNGGEIITAGSSYFIEWNSQNVIDVKIEYSTDNGVNWISIIDSIPSTGIYDWTIPQTFTIQGKVKISDISEPDIFDISDDSFTIQSSKAITVISPNGGEILDGGSQYEILWSSEDVEYVKLEHSINNGASWNSITDSTESTGVYLWTVPNILTTQARIKISDISLPSIYDASDEPFRINYVVSVDENVIATVYKLHQNFPNPFNPTTTINYQIPELSFVTIKVYDVLGNELAALVNKEMQAGSYEVEFVASSLPSGIYLYTIQAGKFADSKKMILLK